MDELLQKRLNTIDHCIDEIKSIEARYFSFEAQEKVLFSQLLLSTDAKTVSIREAQAYTNPEWKNYLEAKVRAKTEYNRARRKYELLLKAFDAEYLSMKVNSTAIRRQGQA